MGNNNSSGVVLINLERENSFFFSGEIVTGMVTLNVTNEKLEADEIFIVLTGEIGYTTKRTVTSSKGRTSTRTDYHHVPFYTGKVVFAQPQPGQKQLILNHGQYSWPFEICLGDYLPPTINAPASYPHVRYYLQVVIDKPWYKPNTRETRYLTVYPRVNLLQNPQCLVPTIFGNHNRKDIILKGTLNKLGYVPGESISISLEIENPRKVLVKRLELIMLQSYYIGRNQRVTSFFRVILPNILERIDEQIRETFVLTIPSQPIPPSYQFQGGIQRPAIANIHYFFRLEVKVQGIFADFSVDIPITIGTEPPPHFNQQQTLNSVFVSYADNPEQTTFEHDTDAPPDYHSITQNGK